MTLSVRHLSKSYGRLAAVSDISFDIAPGEIYGLLGRNGAGKTTVIESIIGLIEPDHGEIQIDGLDARANRRAAKRRIGAVLQSSGLQDEITPREAIELFAALHGVAPRNEQALARFDLTDKADARYASLSGGQKQRLALALAFVHDPPVIVLDEPSVSLDPPMRRALHDLIRAMKRAGKAVLLATHDMEEADLLCDRVGIIEAGRIVREGAPSALIAAARATMGVTIELSAPFDVNAVTAPELITAVSVEGPRLRFRTRDLNAALTWLIADLNARGLSILSLRAGAATLEDVVLDIVGPSKAEPS